MTRRDLIFRVFVSSTFGDLVAERNALQEKTFPELRKYCQERGARFQAIDLRWGVSQEAALDQQTMRICLEELKRCQTLSPRPNFIVLLGNRYGWRPLPAEIEAGEFEELLSRVPNSDKALLTNDDPAPPWRDGRRIERVAWYRKDLNAVPPMYVLQPRTIELPSPPPSPPAPLPVGVGSIEDDRKRIRLGESHDWAVLERRMREAFLTAIAALGWPADDPRRVKYEASATHQEIRAGALEAQDPQDHVFCYFREIDGLPADESAAAYRDIRDGAVDADAEGRLLALRAQLEGILPNEHVHTYRAAWQSHQPEYDRRDLCDDVERDLKAIINREIAEFKQRPTLEHEREAHREFAEERYRHFVGRQDVLERIDGYLADPTANRPLVIHGVSGCGKTALMAEAFRRLEESLPSTLSSRPSTLVFRFIGATPGSSDLRTLLGDLCREFGVQEIPQDMNELVRAFRSQLSTEQSGGGQDEAKQPPTDQRPIVLFLDALDQLNPADNARILYWMPRELKPNVKLVVSVLETQPDADDRTRREDPYDLARRIWPQSLVEIGPLDEASAAGLLDAWLAEAGRTLQPEQRAEVLGKFAHCPLPLYLKLAAEEARRWRSWEGVQPLSGTVEGLLEQLLVRLERPEHHGETLVGRSLAYLAAGKNGLTEDELLDVLSRDKDVVQNFAQRSPESPKIKENDPLPVIVWSRLLDDIHRYMTHRRADGTVVMDFYHRQVGEAVQKRYLPSEEVRARAHQQLADYFATLDYWAETLEAQRARARRLPPTPRPANVRKVVELPYHRLEVAKLAGKDDPHSKHWDAVADLLTDWQFLEAKAEADPNFQEQESVEPSPATGEARP
jgi:NACHT domain- and WD repeat-containing protein